MDRAEQNGALTCDNLSMLALRWHDDYVMEQSTAISTEGMAADGITTKMEGFARHRPPEGSNLSDAEIEKAIDEINLAIKKFSRFDPGK
jgi:hypothetical protein